MFIIQYGSLLWKMSARWRNVAGVGEGEMICVSVKNKTKCQILEEEGVVA